MMPFKTFSNEGELVSDNKLRFWLADIESRGFDGVTLDFWWRFTEPSPQEYHFENYHQFMKILQEFNLKIKPILSFHQCGSTIGDECWIPLPDWVLKSNQNIFYRDDRGHVNKEYISVFADKSQLSDGRVVMQVYQDYIREFHNQFSIYYGSLIVDIELGSGPAGQLHYPSYSYNLAFCGVGRFLGSSDLAIESFKNFLNNVNQQLSSKQKDSFLLSNPNERFNFVGTPLIQKEDHKPYQESFFKPMDIFNSECSMVKNKIDCGTFDMKQDACLSKGCCWREVKGDPYCYYQEYNLMNYKSEYGKMWNYWYQEAQLEHLQNLLNRARKELDMRIPLSIKLPCIHWLANEESRSSEMTAGFMVHNQNEQIQELFNENVEQYYEQQKYSEFVSKDVFGFENIWDKSLDSISKLSDKVKKINTYNEIFKLAKIFKTKVVFSCVELTHKDFPEVCMSSPENLMDNFKLFSQLSKVPIIAENTEKLQRHEIDQKLNKIRANLPGFYQFNYMRMEDAEGEFFQPTSTRPELKRKESVKNELVELLDNNQSSNFYRKRKIILMEVLNCRNCYGDLENFKKRILRLV